VTLGISGTPDSEKISSLKIGPMQLRNWTNRDYLCQICKNKNKERCNESKFSQWLMGCKF
jgi:hypothetical protein